MTGPLQSALLPLYVAVALLATVASCGGSPTHTSIPQTNGPGKDYPVNILESSEHRDAVLAEWSRIYEAFGVSPEKRRPPELEPFTHTPRTLGGVGPIRLARSGTGEPLDDDRTRLLLRQFIADHEQALGITAGSISLDEVSDTGTGLRRFSFLQSALPHPIARPFGRLDVTLDANGDIVEISDTAIPSAEIPSEPTISREEAVKRLVGATLTFHDKTGATRQITLDTPDKAVARRLVIYPEATEAALRIRLVWEIEAGSDVSWVVYVDAITGETVKTQQNSET